MVNGIEVGSDYRVLAGDVLEFCRTNGCRAGVAPKWISLREAADYLRIGVKSLKAMCKARKVCYVRHGKQGRARTGEYRFQQGWLDEYIERATVEAMPPIIERFRRVKASPLVTEVFIDPRKCGNPFEEI